jgi:hypothetical protein
MARQGLMDDEGYNGFDVDDERCENCKYASVKEENGQTWFFCQKDYLCDEVDAYEQLQ